MLTYKQVWISKGDDSMNGFTQFTIRVARLGNVEDYLHLPLIKNGNAVGTISKAVEVDGAYELTVTRFVKVELTDGAPSAIIIP